MYNLYLLINKFIKYVIAVVLNLYPFRKSQTINKNESSLMTLPDEILVYILSHLNQIHICRICMVNKRFYILGKAKLYHSIYITSSKFQLLISPNLHTPFHRKFTISNRVKPLGPNIDLVKRIVFRFFCSAFYDMQADYPSIDVICEEKFHFYDEMLLNGYPFSKLKYSMIDARCEEKIPLHQRTYNRYLSGKRYQFERVITLSLHLSWNRYLNLQIVRKMTRLTNLKITAYDYVLLNQLLAIGVKDLPINSLEIIYQCAITGNSILDLHEIFNLEILTTLQLESMIWSSTPYNLADEIRELLSKLTNIKHLSLAIPDTRYDGVLDLLKPNSLHSIYLKFYWSSFERFLSQNILEGQEGSLERICLSTFIRSSLRGYKNGIGEMDKILKATWQMEVSESKKYLKHIGDMVRGGKRFQKLNQVMYNECCYSIERSAKGNVSVIPCNIFRTGEIELGYLIKD
ncbi:hypothetical protein JA1_003637 [Spathaspora sp. JA1]|nr:hypothetical protein JA1_003637 [Spathaspora sp. JA1]